MSIFERIKNAIWKHAESGSGTSKPSTSGGTPAPNVVRPSAAPAPSSPASPGGPAATTSGRPVDIEAVLEARSKSSSQPLNWRTSIVDLMKLVDLDPSLANRKELAQELGYSGDTSDSAAMNIWLHKQVMKKLAESGGTVPASLRS